MLEDADIEAYEQLLSVWFFNIDSVVLGGGGGRGGCEWLRTVLSHEVVAAGNSSSSARLLAGSDRSLGADDEGRSGNEDSGELGHCEDWRGNRSLKADGCVGWGCCA